MASYVVMEASDLRALCEKVASNIEQQRARERRQLVEGVLARRNKWRRRFFMRQLTLEEVGHDIIDDLQAEWAFGAWHIAGMIGGAAMTAARELSAACEVANRVHVAVDDLHRLRSWA